MLHKETPEICEKQHKTILAVLQICAPAGNRHRISQSNIKISCIVFAQISLVALTTGWPFFFFFKGIVLVFENLDNLGCHLSVAHNIILICQCKFPFLRVGTQSTRWQSNSPFDSLVKQA